MIDDIIYDSTEFIMEIPLAAPGGVITAYSLDGSNFDVAVPGEKSYVFVT